MELKVISSNSSGNCYLLENDQECLIIELGVNFEKIKKAVRFNFRKVVGALCTHAHGDHSVAMKHAQAIGVNVYSSAGTFKALGVEGHHRSKVVKAGQEFKIGNFTILPFDVEHDVPEPLGFLIHHKETGYVLFLTDSFYCKSVFPGLNNIIIEANYSQAILDDRVRNGMNPKFLRDRIITSHMSLDTCKKTLRANDLSAVNNIVLIHLSDSNSNEQQFKREVEEATGKTVHVAVPGLTIPFNIKPF